jgi:hypothetical protein
MQVAVSSVKRSSNENPSFVKNSTDLPRGTSRLARADSQLAGRSLIARDI